MKTVFSFIAFLPLLLFAQKKLPFIETITSDTLNGKYHQMIFAYDQENRVENIFETHCKTKKVSKNDISPLVDTVSIQHFNYDGKSKNPISRKTTSFEFDTAIKASVWSSVEMHVFIYKEGKHIQDSITYKENRTDLEENHPYKNKVYNWKGTLEYSSNSFKYLIDRNYLTRGMYDYTYGSTTELLINSQQNISKEIEKELIKSHSSSNPPYFTMTKFDKSINPFSYLNIAEILPYEKVFLAFDIYGLIGKEEEAINSGYTLFNWYFFNKNNIINYSITRGETDSDFSDVIHLSYNYNQLNLPIQCFAEIRKVYRSDGKLALKCQKRFTFRYRK